MSVDVLAVVISCGALVGFYVLLYAPLVARLDNEIKRTRFLLLLFPEEVAKGERRGVLLPAAAAAAIRALTSSAPLPRPRAGVPAVIAAGKRLAESSY
jgi:hypothetical protein